MTTAVTLRTATAADIDLILGFIQKLAEYERLANEVVVTRELLQAALFSPAATAEVTLAYVEGEPAGFALYFHNFSTFVGRRGLYLEDLFVEPRFRGRGIGKRLLHHLAALAVERGCGRFEWAVLDWNEPAIRFYESLGARMMSDWRIFRLSGDALRALANGGRRNDANRNPG